MTESSPSWRSRIVGHGELAPGDLVSNPRNWRQHPKAQADALAGVLDEVGWVQDVIVNRRTGHLIDGHLRAALAVERREPTVPVIYVDLDEHEEVLVLATLDPLSAMATTDAEQYDAILRDVETQSAAVQAMMSKAREDSGVTDLTEKLEEEEVEIRPRKLFHALVSLPIDGAIEAKEILDQIGELPEASILYATN